MTLPFGSIRIAAPEARGLSLVGRMQTLAYVLATMPITSAWMLLALPVMQEKSIFTLGGKPVVRCL
jgi:hypothetical protein